MLFIIAWMISIGLNSEWDLMLVDRPDGKKDLAFFAGAEAVVLHAKQRLLHHFGEWFLNPSAGVPWQQTILSGGIKSRYNIGLSETLIKKVILDTPGIVEFVTQPVFEWDFRNSQQGRILRVIQARVLVDCGNSRQSADMELTT